MTDPDASRLRRWLRLIEWACPTDHPNSLVRAAGDAARAAIAGDEPPDGPIHTSKQKVRRNG